MNQSLRVEIETGNDAMLTGEDLAGALETVAGELRAGALAGRIADLNGNTCGSWWLEDPE